PRHAPRRRARHRARPFRRADRRADLAHPRVGVDRGGAGRAGVLGGGGRDLRRVAGVPRGHARSHRVSEVRVMGRLTGLANALTDTFRASMSTLATNKLRSALTLLGIVIGIVSIVMMVSAVTGVQTSVEKDLAQLGSGVFQVQKWPAGFGPRNRAMYEKRKNFTLAHVQLLQMHCRECLRGAREAWEVGESIATARRVARNGSQVAGGSGPEFFDNNGYALAKGRYFSEGEALSGADVIVLGADVKDLLFPDEDPLGQLVRVKQRPLRVIG